MRVFNAEHPRPGFRAIAEENVPNRFETFLLGDGEKKVTEEPDTSKHNHHTIQRHPLLIAGARQGCNRLQFSPSTKRITR